MESDAQKDQQWVPPTPPSLLIPLAAPSPPPLVGFELPPPLTSLPRIPDISTKWKRKEPVQSVASLLNNDSPAPRHQVSTSRATPSSLARDDDADGLILDSAHGAFTEDSTLEEPEIDDDSPLSSIHPLHSLPALPSQTETGTIPEDDPYSRTRKRPRRDASEAAKLALRQPSPLDLSPPFRPTGSGSGGRSQANRKVSHSLIERRRREKINQCLATLREVVPQCREEGERKEAKAKERGRKRGKKNEEGEEGQRGGLHKLEILEGTILYIRQLEERVSELEATGAPSPRPESRSSSTTDLSTLSSGSAEPTATSSLSSESRGTAPVDEARVAMFSPRLVAESVHDDALLLLKFSTSPELRPVFFD